MSHYRNPAAVKQGQQPVTDIHGRRNQSPNAAQLAELAQDRKATCDRQRYASAC